jgi:hypothetical protein
VSRLLECPECQATDFLQIQHGYVYWSTTFDNESGEITDLEPWEFGDAETVGYECRGCSFAFSGESELV